MRIDIYPYWEKKSITLDLCHITNSAYPKKTSLHLMALIFTFFQKLCLYLWRWLGWLKNSLLINTASNSIGKISSPLQSWSQSCIRHDTENSYNLLWFFSVPCAPGTYSTTGVEPCLPCAKGYYQSSVKQTSCLLCGGGMSTYGVGASSLSQCIGKHCSMKMFI